MHSAAITRSAKGVTLQLDEIQIPPTARPYNASAVTDLVRSIQRIGLQSAPTVVERDRSHILVAGRHRIEALRVLGVESVLVRVVDFDDIEARLWTICENLHRAELTVAQRAEHVAEYADLARQRRDAERVSAQVAPKPQGGRPEAGDRMAARDLRITREEIRRAQAIAALPEETKNAARSLGYDDNQAALLAASRAETPEEQISVLNGIAAYGSVTAASRAASEIKAAVLEQPALGAPNQSVKPLRNLENISGGELARWIKITTPNDRPHVIRVLETAAGILRLECEGGSDV
jgi:ParB-like chromosome segregation protein Spo0J